MRSISSIPRNMHHASSTLARNLRYGRGSLDRIRAYLGYSKYSFAAYWYLGPSRGEAEGYRFLAPIVEERKKLQGSYEDIGKDQEPVSRSSERSKGASRI